MLLTDLLPVLKELSRADQLRVMLFLISEFAKEESVTPMENGVAHRVYSPYSDEAAEKLAKLLKDHQISNDA